MVLLLSGRPVTVLWRSLAARLAPPDPLAPAGPLAPLLAPIY